MIEASDVVYEYPTARALDGVSFTLAKGSVTALVGPNGAGKTTLLRCLAALDSPYSGAIRIDGLDTRKDPRGVHARLGYLPDFFGLYDELTVRQCLIYAARARGVPAAKAEAAAKTAAGRVHLTDRYQARAGELSRGLRQRLAIGQSLVHSPAILLLDEPASGLDPDARQDLSKLMLELRDEGITLLVSSHILAELEDYCSEMLVMRDGRLAGGGPVRAADDLTRIRIRLSKAREGLGEFLKAQPGVRRVESANGVEAVVEVEPGPDAGPALLRALMTADFSVAGFEEEKRTLAQAYRNKIKHGAAA